MNKIYLAEDLPLRARAVYVRAGLFQEGGLDPKPCPFDRKAFPFFGAGIDILGRCRIGSGPFVFSCKQIGTPGVKKICPQASMEPFPGRSL